MFKRALDYVLQDELYKVWLQGPLKKIINIQYDKMQQYRGLLIGKHVYIVPELSEQTDQQIQKVHGAIDWPKAPPVLT